MPGGDDINDAGQRHDYLLRSNEMLLSKVEREYPRSVTTIDQ
jgi:hypothetical protein